MLSKEEIEKGKAHLEWLIDRGILTSEDEPHIKAVLNYIEQLEQENRRLKVGLNNGLNKDQKNCFYEDGKTGKCLGYSFFNNDEPCIYCQTCEALSIKRGD